MILRKPEGLLSLLYAKRLQETYKPGMNLRDMENLLACAREHLEFSLWYLREKGLIQMGDNGQYCITALGVDTCNETEVSPTREDRLLTAGKEPANGNTASSRAPGPEPKAPRSRLRQPLTPNGAAPSKKAAPAVRYRQPEPVKH